MYELFNRPFQKDLRKALRRDETLEERCLWNILKNKQLGYKFRRQHGIDSFIVDFYCREKLLVIEIDGAPHFTEEGMRHDEERTKILEQYGVKVIRFTNDEVMKKIDVVLKKIRLALSERVLPSCEGGVGGGSERVE